jgi:hypothetical protein
MTADVPNIANEMARPGISHAMIIKPIMVISAPTAPIAWVSPLMGSRVRSNTFQQDWAIFNMCSLLKFVANYLIE